ncbi:hypothetical protein KIL84_022303 [Mauremys mutica]|uniref:Uncharacterized protein n=1 Tax=Mauremys mutica TaxID=74926 RepID=A0A9D3XAF2_9SAUR|nr:hypothetical protein KIL84_022303 [Mauremys mutica]
MEPGVIYPLSDSPSVKMSQSSPADEGTTFEHLWSTLEPDSTYFDLPPSSHSGSSEVSNQTEVTMDVFQMRSMNESVMSQFNLLNSSMDQSIGSRAASTSPYNSEHPSNVPTHSPYSQPSSTFDAMSPAPVIPSNADYPGPHHFEVTFQQSSTAKSATWTPIHLGPDSDFKHKLQIDSSGVRLSPLYLHGSLQLISLSPTLQILQHYQAAEKFRDTCFLLRFETTWRVRQEDTKGSRQMSEAAQGMSLAPTMVSRDTERANVVYAAGEGGWYVYASVIIVSVLAIWGSCC